MPNPAEFKNKEAFMAACMEDTKAEGLSHKHSLGKCLGMAREHFGGNHGKTEPTKKEK